MKKSSLPQNPKQLELALKPCRSPYCECSDDKCSHPGCYDARSEPWPFPVFPNPKDVRNNVSPKFNPSNHEEAPL
jgi:hypothetical protein